MSIGSYTGIDNLEVMQVAVKYRRYLTGLVTRVAGPPRAGYRMLDFGAGAGTQAVDFRRLGYDVTCVELDDTLRARLCQAGFVTVATIAELEGQIFDLAYTMNVLEHIDDELGALRNLHRVIAPGGDLVVYVPAFQALYTSMDAKVGHLRRYRRHQLVDVVTAAGFEVRSAEYADSLGFFAALAYRAIGNRDGDLDERAISLYDRFVFPASRVVDHGAGRWLGKNVALLARRGPGEG